MSVSYEDAVATLESMFPKWDKGTLGDFFIQACHTDSLCRLCNQKRGMSTVNLIYFNCSKMFRNSTPAK